MSKRSNTTNIITHKPPFKLIQLQILWEDGQGNGGKAFDDVHQLAEFLKANPAFAEALKYVSKR